MNGVQIPSVGGTRSNQILARFGKRDIESGLAQRRAVKEILQRECCFAGSRVALKKVKARIDHAPTKQFVQSHDTRRYQIALFKLRNWHCSPRDLVLVHNWTA